ncbi:MAG: OsmC family protein [Dehalococcoidia bacterium]|nr:OsmC family protein [Dehalococcoidia bacterium]
MLAARGIRVKTEDYTAQVEGRVEKKGLTIGITEIGIHYRLTVPAGRKDDVQRALETHFDACPGYQSVKGAIEVRWTADVREEAPAE